MKLFFLFAKTPSLRTGGSRVREYRCDIVMVNVSFYGTTGEEHPIVVRDSESAIVASAVPALKIM